MRKVALLLALSMIVLAATVEAHSTAEPTTGTLYAGGTNPCCVYEYLGGTTWQTIGTFPSDYSVLCLAVYQDVLYAGTMSNRSISSSVGRVYRYDSGTGTWSQVGGDLDNMVNVLEVYEDDLYAGTSWAGAKLYWYNAPNSWDLVVNYTGWSGIRAAHIWDGWLYLGDLGYDKIGRFDGTNFTHIVNLGGSCIWDFIDYEGSLYASAYCGRIHGTPDGTSWTPLMDYLPNCRNVWQMEVFGGQRYFGTDCGGTPGQAWLCEWNGGSTYDIIWNPSLSHSWEGIISMATNGELLFIGMGTEVTYFGGTGGTGQIYAYDGTGSPELISGTMGEGLQALLWGPLANLPPECVCLEPCSVEVHKEDAVFFFEAFDQDDDGLDYLIQTVGPTPFNPPVVTITDDVPGYLAGFITWTPNCIVDKCIWYHFELKVTDGVEWDTCHFRAHSYNEPPWVVCPPDEEIHGDHDTYVGDFTYGDPEDDHVDIRLDIQPDPPTSADPQLSYANGSGTVTWTPNCEDNGTQYTIILWAIDQCEDSSSCSFVLTVTNQPPWVNCPPDEEVHGDHDTYVGSFTYGDPEGDLVTIQLDIQPDPPTNADPQLNYANGSGTVTWTPNCEDNGTQYTIVLTAIDTCQAQSSCSFVLTVTNQPPWVNCPPDEEIHGDHDTYIGSFTYGDPEGDRVAVDLDIQPDPPTSDDPQISYANGSGTVTWTPNCEDNGTQYTIVLTAIDTCQAQSSCSFVLTVTNDPPWITCPEDGSVHGDHETYVGNFTYGDPEGDRVTVDVDIQPDPPTSSDPEISYASGSGTVSWTPNCEDIGTEYTIVLTATDTCQASSSCSFTLTVTNEPPFFTSVPASSETLHAEHSRTYSFTADDPEGDPICSMDISATLGTISGITPSIPPCQSSPVTVSFTYTAPSVEQLTDVDICIMVDDTCEAEAETCFTVHIKPLPRIIIPNTDSCVNPGEYVCLPILLRNNTTPLGGFELEVEFDYTSMTFVGVEPGVLIEGFEKFTYRLLPCPSCGCCKYKILLYGQYDLPNGIENIGDPIPRTPMGEFEVLVSLCFVVNNDENLRGLKIPVCWEWEGTVVNDTLVEDWECGENTFSTWSGDTLFTSKLLCQFNPEICDDPTDRIRPILVFQDGICGHNCGGVDICPAGPGLCKRGDVNMNTITYEVADAVLFASYFVGGTVVFRYDVPYQVCATDVNADGRTLTLSDLVYLIRVILHDAVELPKLTPSSEVANVIVSDCTISTECAAPIGAILFEFDAAVNPTLLADMEMLHKDNKVLVWSREGNSFSTAEVLSFTGEAELVSVSAVDRDSRELTTSIVGKVAPTAFALHPAYPNPFNPFTNLSFTLPEAINYSLRIYNVAGQLVRSLEGIGSVGLNVVTWDSKDNLGSEVASGIYFYKLSAGSFSATKKMVMMK